MNASASLPARRSRLFDRVPCRCRHPAVDHVLNDRGNPFCVRCLRRANELLEKAIHSYEAIQPLEGP